MALSGEMIAIAVELIAEFGADVPFTGKSGGTFNEATSTVSGETIVNQTVKALGENKGLWLDGVVKGERKLTIAADGLTFTPAPGLKFVSMGKTFKVMDKGVISTEVEGVPVIYEIYGVSG